MNGGRALALASMLVGSLGATSVPDHVLTAVQDLCYQRNCYHAPTRVPLKVVARYVDWAQPDLPDAARPRGRHQNDALHRPEHPILAQQLRAAAHQR
jgi:hypothetical protein